MTFITHHWVLLVLGILGVIVIACQAGGAIFEAYVDTRKIPRESMFWCSNGHGYIRKKNCLELFPGMKQQNGEPFLVCPMCYQASIFQGQDARGIKLG